MFTYYSLLAFPGNFLIHLEKDEARSHRLRRRKARKQIATAFFAIWLEESVLFYAFCSILSINCAIKHMLYIILACFTKYIESTTPPLYAISYSEAGV